MDWYVEVLRKYAVFNGRARRKEYWMFTLVNFIIGTVLVIFPAVFAITLFEAIYNLFIFIPTLAVSVRRLHDTNRSGWWMLILLVPLVGWIFFLVFMIQEGIPGINQYGPNPKEITDESQSHLKGMKKCPNCAKPVKREARVCPFCQHEFYAKPKTVEEEIKEFEQEEKRNYTKPKDDKDFGDEEIV